MTISLPFKRDFEVLVVGGLLLIALLSAASFAITSLTGLPMDLSRPIAGAAAIVGAGIYIVRAEIALAECWGELLSFSGAVLGIGCYGAASEVYRKHFTILGIGDVPSAFTVIYLATVAALAAIWICLLLRKD